jgi:2-polyprenyl-6-methoxyphenol hydroxylase-like FAD-dependent oxidoreductase
MKPETEVLIVGAGPTGLVLALWLTHFGVKVRVVDRAAEPGTTSRALAVHARILEAYDQLDLAGAIIDRGLKIAAVNLWVAGAKKGRVVFGDMGQGISPFPYALIFPQDEHERLLIERLAALGVSVERSAEFINCETKDDRVTTRLRRSDGTEEAVEAAFLASCDGAHSAVREALRIGFSGGTYPHVFYVADVEASGRAMNGELNVALDEAEFLAIFPLQGTGRARFIGTVKREAEARRDVTFDDVSAHLIDRLDIKVTRVNWFSTYRVHHRVAAKFRDGRIFLLGDAAHIHSPVGGQGMNTGIGDAVNLAWKLAAVLRGRAGIDLLDSYELERSAFARRLVATTDRAFQFINNDGPIARLIRIRLVPLLLPAIFSFHDARRLMFLTLSQTNVTYRDSALATGSAGRIRAGDRLPWVRQKDGVDNFVSLRSLDWQAHIYGDASIAIEQVCTQAKLSLRRFPWNEAAGKAGIARDAFYLVRPDGYIGLAAANDVADKLLAYQTRHGLVFADANRSPPEAEATRSGRRWPEKI